jgi:hypothetical protein
VLRLLTPLEPSFRCYTLALSSAACELHLRLILVPHARKMRRRRRLGSTVLLVALACVAGAHRDVAAERCHTPEATGTRVAVAFFGLSRNLRLTLPTIQRNLLRPIQASGNVLLDVFVHAMIAGNVTNKRSEEANGALVLGRARTHTFVMRMREIARPPALVVADT